MAKSTTTTKKSGTKTVGKHPKTTVRKPKVKKTGHKKSSTKSNSFRLTPETQSFTSFKITEQTVYWFIFALAILLLGLWILYVNIKVQDLYDQIDQNHVMQIELDDRLNKARNSN